MNVELLYTSSPQGLKGGSRGFCTVLSTAGLPDNLALRLEALSGYRHLYQPSDPDSESNPICFSFVTFQVGGRRAHVLSRIAAYGVDYSQRTNKLAHHLVVDFPLPSCGPAAILARPGAMRDEWDGVCRSIPTGPIINDSNVVPKKCELWERLTGDAGWGGTVAKAWMNPQPKPTWIIFDKDQSSRLLPLLMESVALLPENNRWQATFRTYFTKLPLDVECVVRCVLAGTEEARMAKMRGPVIDLTCPLGLAPESFEAHAARTGSSLAPKLSMKPTALASDYRGGFDRQRQSIGGERSSPVDNQLVPGRSRGIRRKRADQSSQKSPLPFFVFFMAASLLLGGILAGLAWFLIKKPELLAGGGKQADKQQNQPADQQPNHPQDPDIAALAHDQDNGDQQNNNLGPAGISIPSQDADSSIGTDSGLDTGLDGHQQNSRSAQNSLPASLPPAIGPQPGPSMPPNVPQPVIGPQPGASMPSIESPQENLGPTFLSSPGPIDGLGTPPPDVMLKILKLLESGPTIAAENSTQPSLPKTNVQFRIQDQDRKFTDRFPVAELIPIVLNEDSVSKDELDWHWELYDGSNPNVVLSKTIDHHFEVIRPYYGKKLRVRPAKKGMQATQDWQVIEILPLGTIKIDVDDLMLKDWNWDRGKYTVLLHNPQAEDNKTYEVRYGVEEQKVSSEWKQEGFSKLLSKDDIAKLTARFQALRSAVDIQKKSRDDALTGLRKQVDKVDLLRIILRSLSPHKANTIGSLVEFSNEMIKVNQFVNNARDWAELDQNKSRTDDQEKQYERLNRILIASVKGYPEEHIESVGKTPEERRSDLREFGTWFRNVGGFWNAKLAYSHQLLQSIKDISQADIKFDLIGDVKLFSTDAAELGRKKGPTVTYPARVEIEIDFGEASAIRDLLGKRNTRSQPANSAALPNDSSWVSGPEETSHAPPSDLK